MNRDTLPDFNILLTSAGRRVSLLRSFITALDTLALPGKVFAGDASGLCATRYFADGFIQLPRVTEAHYVDKLIEVCQNHAIRVLVPLIDTELSVLAENRELLQAHGVVAIVSSIETALVGNDKLRTFGFFQEIGLQAPRTVTFQDGTPLPADWRFPVVVKPREGSAGVGVQIVDSEDELAFHARRTHQPLLQEYISGTEFTLDILVDRQGHVRCVVPRRRLEIRSGEVSKGITEKRMDLVAAGKLIGERLPGAFGCITAQCIVDVHGTSWFIEINPRFGGGFPLADRAGARFPLWLIQMIAGQEPEIALSGWDDGLLMIRYDAEVYAELQS